MTHFCNLFTRFRFCLVGFAVFCFSSAPVCAELTAQQMQNAVYMGTSAALYDWQSDFQPYSPTVINTFPVDENNASLGYYLSPDSNADHAYLPTVISLLRTLSPSNDLASIIAFLGSVSNQLDKTEIGSYANTVDTWLQDIATALYDEMYGTPLLNKIRNLTYSDKLELRVHDYEAISFLEGIDSHAKSIDSFVEGIDSGLYSLIDIVNQISSSFHADFSEITQVIKDQTDDIIEHLEQDPTVTERDAQDDVDDSDMEADESLEDTSGYYEYEVPELEEPDEPTTSTAADSSGVGDISLDVQHSALITLTRGNDSHTSASPFLPSMEIDLATTPGATNFISQLSILMHYGWDAVFAFLGFLLYYSTFRRIRHMLIATRAGFPPGEPFSLHYDPF